MSFIDTLGSIVKGVGGFLSSNTIGSTIAKTALLGYALNRVNKSINKQNDQGNLPPQPLTLNPDTTNHIPILYGTSYVTGMITDAFLEANNTTMWFCITLCEKTGNLINGTNSVITFKEVYYNGFRLDFQSDGYTVDLAYDDEGNSTTDFQGNIEIYPFNDGGDSPTGFTTETTNSNAVANTLFPSWTAAHDMSGLVFALVKIKYNPEKNINGVGTWEFRLSNTMTQPGDCLYDYMTNTRYGAGIPEAEILVQ